MGVVVRVSHEPVVSDPVVLIGAFSVVLKGISPFSDTIILDGFRMAFKHRRVLVQGRTYELVDIFTVPEQPENIYARIQEVIS